jgi:polyphenol oxidase
MLPHTPTSRGSAMRVALVLLTADCLPVAYVDVQTGAYALLHLGWRSIVEGLATDTLAALHEQYGTHAPNVRVSIGPCITKESYLCDSPITQCGSEWEPFLHTSGTKTAVDLPGYVAACLRDKGVPAGNIELPRVNTGAEIACFSHYRSTLRGDVGGRMLTVLASS